MKVSVVTVARNSARSICYTLESFLEQTHGDAELILVDGASTDGTVAIAEGFRDPRIRVYSEPDNGLYEAMNKGLGLFRGDAVGFLNSDDRFHDRTTLERIAERLATHEIVFGDLDFVRDHATRTVVRRWRGGRYRPGAFRSGWMPAHPTFYVRRSVVQRVGLFDTQLSIAADYDFMLRAMETGSARSAYIPHVLVDMMVGGNSTRNWRAYVRGNLECLASRRKWLRGPVLDYALFAKPARKVGQLFF